MAGSNRFFLYIDDLGRDWAINRDESSTELVNGAAATVVPSTAASILIGKGSIEPRYLNYNSANGLLRRKVVFLSNTPEALASAPVVISVPTEAGALSLQLTSYVGERQRFVPQTDTRQTDGDSETSGAGGGG